MLQVLKRLYQQGLQIDINKCKFLTTKVKYLGIIVITKSIKIDTEKTDAIQQWKAPILVREVQGFLGFANFYQQFIPGFSKLLQPLINATKGSHYVTKSDKKKIKYEVFK